VVEPWLAGLPAALKSEIQRIQSLSNSELQQLQATQIESNVQDEIFQATSEDQSTTKYTAKLV
jgi:hypothetical protein